MNEAMKKKVKQVMDSLDTTTRKLPHDVDVTTNQEKRLILYPRAHAEVMAPLLADLAKKSGLKLAERDVEKEMLDRLDRASALIPLRAAAEEFLRRIDDTITRDRSEAWFTFLAYYRALGGLALSDVKIEAALQPIVEFMSYDAPSKKKAENTDKETPVDTPTPAPVKVVNG